MVIDVTKFNGVSTPNTPTFHKYMYEISKVKPLTRDEEFSLFKRLRENNDEEAFNKLCKHNLLFVVAVAKKFGHVVSNTTSLTIDDLINEGNIGLCIAVRKFDETKGYKLISYAVWHIRQQILSLIQTNFKSIRIPGHIRLLVNKLKKVDEQLEQKYGRGPTTLEVFEELLANGDIDSNSMLDVTSIDEILKIQKTEISLNTLVGDDGICELGDMIQTSDNNPYQTLLIKERHDIAKKFLKGLPYYVTIYIEHLYGLNDYEVLTFAEIGRKYDVQPQTVRNLVEKYLRQIKRRNYSYKDFLFPHLKKDIVG